MKKLSYAFVIVLALFIFACNKTSESEIFKLLTTPTWTSDSLLANGQDASGTGELLANFKGDAKFSSNGTGTFGKYTGKWSLDEAQTEITIITDSLAFPIVCDIVELTTASLKITTVVPDKTTMQPIDIRMTFKAK